MGREIRGERRDNTESGNDGVLMGIRNMGERYWWGAGIAQWLERRTRD